MPVAVSRIGIEVTSEPGAGASVSGPISSTSAENSWPMKMSASKSSSGGSPPIEGMPLISLPSAIICWPCLAKCRSLPQMPHAFTCTSTCPKAGSGSGTSSRT
jgi:hypothetical protein